MSPPTVRSSGQNVAYPPTNGGRAHEPAGPLGTIIAVTGSRPPRAPQQLLRLLAVGAVLVGIVLMHSSPILPASQSAHATASSTASQGYPDIGAAADGLPAVIGSGCADGDECGHHTGLHLCMAVVVIAALLVLSRWHLGRVSGDPARAPRLAWLRRRAGRPPPWTTPTLAQLSVLRV